MLRYFVMLIFADDTDSGLIVGIQLHRSLMVSTEHINEDICVKENQGHSLLICF